MAGAAKNYDATKIVLGPSDLWINVAVPGAGARLSVALSAAGQPTPDATANPNAKHLGMTAAGCTFTYTPEIQKFNSDELTFPHRRRIVGEEAMIEGEFLQCFDWDILEKMTVGGTKSSNTSTTSGYDQLTMGGLSDVPMFSIALIGQELDAPTKYWVIQLYKAANTGGLKFGVTRKDQTKSPFKFEADGIPTRAVGDQACNFWHSIVAAA